MENAEEKTKLLAFWHTHGTIKELANVTNVINPITSQSHKKLNYSRVINPLYYEIDLNKNRFNDFWFIIDIDIESKNNQKILASRPPLFDALKRNSQIKYCELSMNQGIHVLVNTNFNIQVDSIKKNIKLKNSIETVLRLEFKSKCLVAPSNEYKFQFKHDTSVKMSRSKFCKLIKKIFFLFNHFDLFKFADADLTIPAALFQLPMNHRTIAVNPK